MPFGAERIGRELTVCHRPQAAQVCALCTAPQGISYSGSLPKQLPPEAHQSLSCWSSELHPPEAINSENSAKPLHLQLDAHLHFTDDLLGCALALQKANGLGLKQGGFTKKLHSMAASQSDHSPSKL